MTDKQIAEKLGRRRGNVTIKRFKLGLEKKFE